MMVKRVCEKCQRDESTVRRQDEPDLATIKRRRVRWHGKKSQGVVLCGRCWIDLCGV